MSVLRYPWRPDAGQLRVFAALLALLSSGIGFRAWISSAGPVELSLWGLGLLLGVAGLIRPRLLRGLYLFWMALVFPVAWLVSHLLLLLLFYGLLAPVALTQRLLRRDALLLRRRNASDRPSYWHLRNQPKSVQEYRRQS